MFLAARSFSFISLLYLLEFLLQTVYNPRYVNLVQCMFVSVLFTAIFLEDSSGKFSFSTDLKFLTLSLTFTDSCHCQYSFVSCIVLYFGSILELNRFLSFVSFVLRHSFSGTHSRRNH